MKWTSHLAQGWTRIAGAQQLSHKRVETGFISPTYLEKVIIFSTSIKGIFPKLLHCLYVTVIFSLSSTKYFVSTALQLSIPNSFNCVSK